MPLNSTYGLKDYWAFYCLLGTWFGKNSRSGAGVKKAILDVADQLANHPEMGKRIIGATGKHTQTRWVIVPTYPNYLIFYRPFQDTLVVIRVLHAAQDWTRIFTQ